MRMPVAYLKKKIPSSIKSPDLMALIVCIDVLAVTCGAALYSFIQDKTSSFLFFLLAS
jgi:hypothetical protein